MFNYWLKYTYVGKNDTNNPKVNAFFVNSVLGNWTLYQKILKFAAILHSKVKRKPLFELPKPL